MKAPKLSATALLPSMLLAGVLVGAGTATPASDRVNDGPVVQMTVTPSK